MSSEVVLSGYGVTLRPLTLDDLTPLREVLTPDVVEFIPSRLASEDDLAAYLRLAVEDREAGTALPFAVEDRDLGFVGTTRLYLIDQFHRNAEIGSTMMARKAWRTHVNSACKRLLLGHAFETMNLHRVYFRTDELNARSRAAISRLGAKQDGIFREDRWMPSGRWRNSVFYSILEEEWPATKAFLDGVLSPRT